MGFAIHPAEGKPFVAIGWPGYVGVGSGMTDARLAPPCLTSAIPGQTTNGVRLPLLYRSQLQHCRTLEQVESILRPSIRTIGNHLVVASAADKDEEPFEFTPSDVRRRHSVDGRLTTTNHFQDAELAAAQA